MKNLLFVPLLVALIVPDAPAQSPDNTQPSISIAIVPAKDESGATFIAHDGMFSVVFTNRSEKPIRLWSERCELGYGTLSFRVEDESGETSRMYLQARHSWDWKNQPPLPFVIPPSGTFPWRVGPSDIWGDRTWTGVPEPNSGKAVTLIAEFEIKPNKTTEEHDVWTGRITSEPLQALVVNPTLRTPHEYLDAACPKQALAIMQADPTWVTKRDNYQQSPLHLAVHQGFTEVVRWLLSNGAAVNATAYNRFSPLHLARDPEVVKLLLEARTDVNARDSNGRTALEEAASMYAHVGLNPELGAERDKWRMITKILVDAGARYDIRSACYLGDAERVRDLISDQEQARDKRALRFAATFGRTEIVKLLLEAGADPEDADYGGLTVSYFAIEHPDVLKLLFDAGANPKVRVKYEGNGRGPQGSTLLIEAAGKGFLESAKLLLAHGIDIDVATPLGFTPLHEACGAGHVAMVNWLLENKADPEARTTRGMTPMSLAVSEVRPEHEEDNGRYQAVIHALERGGCDLDVFAAIACNDVEKVAGLLQADPIAGERKNIEGRPALHRAVELDRRKIVKLLLDKGGDVDIRSDEEGRGHMGETGLLEAAFWGRLEIAEMLVEHGANVNAAADGGVVPLHEACRMKHLELAKLLLKHGADVNAIDKRGETPLDWANLYGKSPEFFELLNSHGGRGKASK